MENFQEKIRELIYQESLILYNKCLKVTINKKKIVKIHFNSDLAKELLNITFFKNLNKKIIILLNIQDNNNIYKIIKSHFNNTNIKDIEGSYKIIYNNNNNIEDIINPIKLQILRKFYNYIELDKLENNIFNFLKFNMFIYYHKKYFSKYMSSLGYFILLLYIIHLAYNY